MAEPSHFETGSHYAAQDIPALADLSGIKKKYLDISYAQRSPSEKLDIYLPDDGKGPFPVIVSIHGGAFMIGDKADIQIMPMLKGLERGYAIVGVNYRMSGEAQFPALVQDIKAAIRWLRGHASEYDFNPDKIAVWGGSAGGYLSAMAGTSAGIPELEDLSLGNPDQSSAVQAVVDWFGPTDFLKMDEQLTESGLPPQADQSHSGANSPESLLLGRKITEIPELVSAANPESYIRPDFPPFLIEHGTKDAVVPVQQSVYLSAKLKEMAGEERVILKLIQDGEHADPKFETDENVTFVLDFLDRWLKN